MGFCGQFCRNLESLFSCFFVTICGLVHDVETIHGQSQLLTASGNLFLKCE